MGLTDKHIEVMRCALANGGVIPVRIGDPLLEGMVSMRVLKRTEITDTGCPQYYLVTGAGYAAYELQQLRTED